MPLSFRFTLVAVMLLTLAPSQLASADGKPAAANAPVSYYKHIRPIFQASCFGCHQPAQAKGGLVMTSHAGLLKGGESGDPAIVPNHPDKGTLLDQITPTGNEAPAMPAEGAPLKADQIELVKRWIAEGAKDDSPAVDVAMYTSDNPPHYPAPPVITSVAVSPDGKLLAVAGYHEVLLHNLEKLAPPLTVAVVQGSGEALQTSAVAQGSATTAAVAPPPGRQEEKDKGAAPTPNLSPANPVARLIGLSERVQSLAFSPDGKLLAAIGGSPARMGEVQIWDVATHKLVRSQNVTFDTLYGAAFSPDGALLAFGGADNTLRAIEVKTGKQVFYQMTHADWVMDCVFSVKGTHLISVSRDFSMKLNDVPTQRFIDNITSITPGALKGGLHSVDRHPQRDELLIGGSDGVPKIYRMIREKARKIGDDFNLIRAFPSIPGRIYAVSYSPDGKLVAAGTSNDGAGEVRTFEEANGKPVATMQDITGGIYTVAFLPDGQRLVSAGFSGTVYIHEARTGKLLAQFVPVPLK